MAIMPDTRRFLHGTLPVAIHDWGGDGPPVLLAHPTGFHGRVWAPVASRLVAAGRRTWSFDFRGHGDSDRSPDGYQWSRFADDVLAVTNELGIAGDEDLLAVGHSKGAAALLLAEADRPHTYPRLYCFEPIVRPSDQPLPPSPDSSLAVNTRKRRFVWSSPAEALASYGGRPPLDVLHPDALRAYVEYGLRPRDDGSYELKCRPEDEAEMYAMGAAGGLFPRLREVGCPTVVGCGERSDVIGPPLARTLAARLPNGSVEVFSGRGHFVPLEDPDQFVAVLLRFVGS